MIEIPDVAGPLEDVDLHAQDFDGEELHYLDVRGDQYSGPQPLRFHLRLWTSDREALEQLRDALDDYLDG